MVADIIDVARTITTDAQNRVPHLAFQADQIVDIPVLPVAPITTAYYLRLRVAAIPGVMADITRIMGESDISIEAILQKEPESGAPRATIILLTQKIREKSNWPPFAVRSTTCREPRANRAEQRPNNRFRT